MNLDQDLLDELAILSLFNEHTLQEGIKVHGHQASESDLSATKRLFAKGILSKDDGGYLTSLGNDALEHLSDLARMLNPS
jgi:uncharacterized protein (TIGR02647 family)